MRYFVVKDPATKKWVSVADSRAIGRVLAKLLGQYVPGSVNYVVMEITEGEFRAYRGQPGTVML